MDSSPARSCSPRRRSPLGGRGGALARCLRAPRLAARRRARARAGRAPGARRSCAASSRAHGGARRGASVSGLEAAERAARAEAERAAARRTSSSRPSRTSSARRSTRCSAGRGSCGSGSSTRPASRAASRPSSGARTAQAQIVDDLLDVSRIVRGRAPARRPAGGARARSSRRRSTRCAPPRRRGTSSIAAVLVPRAGPVAGDPGRLQQVVWNLLANAIKFTPPGGRVEVRLEREVERGRRSRCSDTGAGHRRRSSCPHLFERFRQADSSSTRAHGGLGLGLAIVRHLVEAHGGTVAAESDGPGQGATFTVRLPRLRRVPRPRASRRAAAARAERRRRRARSPASSACACSSWTTTATRSRSCGRSSRHAGAQVDRRGLGARGARRALERARRTCSLSDLGMPGEDGYALIRKVREPRAGARRTRPRRGAHRVHPAGGPEQALARRLPALPPEAGRARRADGRGGAARGPR